MEAAMEKREEKSALEKVLLADAVYCTISGGATLVGAGVIAPLLGLGQTWIVAAIGAGVVAYAALLAGLVRSGRAGQGLGWTAVILNLAWIDGTVLLLWGDWLTLEPAGSFLLALVATGVAVFAALGIYATWRLRRA